MVLTIQQGETVYPIYILYRVTRFFANKVKSIMTLFNIYIIIIRGEKNEKDKSNNLE